MCIHCLEDVGRASRGCLEGVWEVSGRCQEGDRNVLECVWKVLPCCKEGSGKYTESQD